MEAELKVILYLQRKKQTSVKYFFFLPVLNDMLIYSYTCLKIWLVMNRHDIKICIKQNKET